MVMNISIFLFEQPFSLGKWIHSEYQNLFKWIISLRIENEHSKLFIAAKLLSWKNERLWGSISCSIAILDVFFHQMANLFGLIKIFRRERHTRLRNYSDKMFVNFIAFICMLWEFMLSDCCESHIYIDCLRFRKCLFSLHFLNVKWLLDRDWLLLVSACHPCPKYYSIGHQQMGKSLCMGSLVPDI